MPDWGVVLALSSIALGLCGSAFCSGAESSFYWVNRVRLAVRSARDDISADVLRAQTDRPARTLTTLLIGNNAFNYFTVLGVNFFLARAALDGPAAAAANALIVTPVLLLVSESLPKELFRVRAERLAYVSAFPLEIMRWALTITLVLPLILALSALIERAIGRGGRGQANDIDEKRRIASLLMDSGGQGTLSGEQTELVDRVLSLTAEHVSDEMIPWGQVVTIREDATREAALRVLARAHVSSMPVVSASGRVLGVARTQRLLAERDAPIASLIEAHATIPIGASLLDAARAVLASPARAAIVEEGSGPSRKPVGLLTLREIAQPLLGELRGW